MQHKSVPLLIESADEAGLVNAHVSVRRSD